MGLDRLGFVAIEACGRAGGISRACGRRSISREPVIEVKTGLDVLDDSLFIWLVRLSLAGRLWVVIVQPHARRSLWLVIQRSAIPVH